MTYKKPWAEYYAATRNKPPRPLLLEALRYVQHKDKAIDIGGGALRDTIYLLECGFDVTVIDGSPLMLEEATRISSPKLHPQIAAFEEFTFPQEEYDLANAMYSLPFCPPEHFKSFFAGAIGALKSGGVFCGHLFGNRDEWAEDPKMTFHTRPQAEALFDNMTVLSFEEEEGNDTTAVGETKYWHTFSFIAKK